MRLGAIVLVASLLVLASCGYQSPRDIERLLTRDIPPGTSKNEVVKFLDANGFDHSANYKPELYYLKSREISARAPGKKYGVFTSARVHVKLTFNEKDMLENIEAREVKTGL